MAKHDFTDEYRALWKSGLGADILAALNQLHDSFIEDAENADSQEKGYGLLKQAAGVRLAVTHLKGKGVVPKARRNGEENNE